MIFRTAALAAAMLAMGPAAARAGDPVRGQAAWEDRCTGCHSMDTDRTGPHHRGVVGRRAGSVPGFDYSPALAKAGFTWDPALIDRWLTNPEALVPGQAMNFRVNDPAVRDDIISYLARESRR